MIAALALMLLAPQQAPATAIEADDELRRASQREGQYAALRRFAASDAKVIGRTVVPAEEALAGPDPRIATQWWVADSLISCDGTLAVNTGPWLKGAASGYFTTVWQRGGEGWRWIADHADALDKPRTAGDGPRVRTASCTGRPFPLPPEIPVPGATYGGGRSPDGTLAYTWTLYPDGRRSFTVFLWDGSEMRSVVQDHVKAAPG